MITTADSSNNSLFNYQTVILWGQQNNNCLIIIIIIIITIIIIMIIIIKMHGQCLTQKEYIRRRHDNIASLVHWKLCCNSDFEHQPDGVEESERCNILLVLGHH